MLLQWSYWLPILVSVGVVFLYRALPKKKWGFAALLVVEAVVAVCFLASPKAEETVMVAIMLACALYRLIGRWKSSSVLGRAAGVVLVLFPLVIGGCAGDLFVFVLFQFLLAIIYILPCRKYRQEGKLKCFSLWIAQFIVLMLLVLPTVNFRISLLWRSEASFGYAILMMPVVTVLPVVLFDLFGPNRT